MGKLVLIAALVALQAATVEITPAQQELLRRSDLSALAPEVFTARLVLTGPDGVPHAVDVWRAGPERLLVRTSEPEGGASVKDASVAPKVRYLLRRDADLWLLTPTAKAPVRLPSSYRLYGGVSIDEVLGVRLGRDYRIAGVQTLAGPPAAVEFDLRASAPGAVFPRVVYRVDAASGRPLQAAYGLRGGKTATVATFEAWHTTPVLHPATMTLRDEMRKGRTTAVAISGLHAVSVPDDVFALTGHAARARLTASTP
ncbi:MAG: outer membrane lipoprotein-sorting protein [Vicinamibacterales bacterium]